MRAGAATVLFVSEGGCRALLAVQDKQYHLFRSSNVARTAPSWTAPRRWVRQSAYRARRNPGPGAVQFSPACPVNGLTTFVTPPSSSWRRASSERKRLLPRTARHRPAPEPNSQRSRSPPRRLPRRPRRPFGAGQRSRTASSSRIEDRGGARPMSRWTRRPMPS